MRTKMAALVTVCAVGLCQVVAQNAHLVPFASSGNGVELAIVNTSSVPLANVKVEAANVPSWLRFGVLEEQIDQIGANGEASAVFTFSVDKSAPVNKAHTLKFVISAPTGEKWTKEITVAIAAPERFELFQNYPNPFSAKGGSAFGGNPSTAISYQLSGDGWVSLKIFDVLGREVAVPLEGERVAGYHREEWDGSRVSSGMYIYQLTATSKEGNRNVARKTMLLLK